MVDNALSIKPSNYQVFVSPLLIVWVLFKKNPMPNNLVAVGIFKIVEVFNQIRKLPDIAREL